MNRGEIRNIDKSSKKLDEFVAEWFEENGLAGYYCKYLGWRSNKVIPFSGSDSYIPKMLNAMPRYDHRYYNGEHKITVYQDDRGRPGQARGRNLALVAAKACAFCRMLDIEPRKD
jgi:hypothetical protein